MRNLKEETLEFLEKCGYSKEDVAWVGTDDYEIPRERFWLLADVEYDEDYGDQEVAADLLVVLRDGTWLERHEYDGRERWEHRHSPERPAMTVGYAFALVKDQAPKGACARGATFFAMNEPAILAQIATLSKAGDAS